LLTRAFTATVLADIKRRKEGAEGISQFWGKLGIKTIVGFVVGKVAPMLITKVASAIPVFGSIVNFIGQDTVQGALSEGAKGAMDWIYGKVEEANPEVFLDPEAYEKQHATAPEYDDEALKKAGFPAKPWTQPDDPNTGYQVKREPWADRRTTLIEKRIALIERLTKDPATYKDKFGYNINKPYNEAQVHGGAKAPLRITAKQKALVNKALKYIQNEITAVSLNVYAQLMKEKLAKATKPKATTPKGGAAPKVNAPHSKFAEHLKTLKVSPTAYLAEARRKAKAAGLAWRLLGWSDDGTHKLQVPNEEGRLVHFGAAGMGDHILYTLLKDPTAEAHRASYLARATKIRGDWKKSPYSANSLAIAVLW
jgi:hypothetical protein